MTSHHPTPLEQVGNPYLDRINKKHYIGTFRLLNTIAPTASFQHNLPSNNNKQQQQQQQQHSNPLKTRAIYRSKSYNNIEPE